MSTLKTTNLQHASAASPAIVLAADGTATAQLSSINGGPLAGTRNRIINGDMRIDQRNAGASVTVTSAGQYTLDRWAVASATSFGGQLTAQRSTTAPAGFTNSLSLTVTTADASIGAAEYYSAIQRLEGYNVADFDWGTANAKTVTLSFWVRASIAGTYSGSLRNDATDRSYVFEYSISSANTWEQKTVTITGDASGTWLKDNGVGIDLWWSVGTGSTYRSSTVGAWQAGTYLASSNQTQLISTNGATFYITGVQLEAGTVATPFERRSYGQELSLCQRYAVVYKADATYSFVHIGTGFGISTTSGLVGLFMPVPMRVYPSITVSSAAHFLFGTPVNGTISAITAAATAGQFDTDNSQIRLDVAGSGFTIGGTLFRANSASAKLTLSSEL